MSVRSYSQQVEAFLNELIAEVYQHEAGLKAELEISPIYRAIRSFIARSAVEELLAGREDRETRYLAEFAVSGYIENQLRERTEEISNGEAQATVEWDGDRIPYRQAPIVLANEGEASRRHELEARTVAETARLNELRAGRLQRAHELARELGFSDYVTLFDTLGDLHLEWLAAQMKMLLERTRELHLSEMEKRLAEAGIPRAEATTGDWSFLRRAREFDALFPKEQLLSGLTRTLAGLGIEMEAQEHLHVDVEERPLKSPRAFCAPIRIPQDVWLVIRPQGGHDDYGAILHEAGHAEHFVNTRADLPVAYRHLGDNSITEAYAFLFGNLQKNPRWLRDVMGVTKVTEYLALNRFAERYMLRRYGAKLQYELGLHRAAELTGQEGTPRLLGEAVQVRVWPENFLFDLDDGFYSASYLRAWMLEVQLRQVLVKQFGEDWFAQREAGDYLRELWGLGQEYNADEMARRLGYEGLDAGPLIKELSDGI